MPKARFRLRAMLIFIGLLALFLATVGRWIASGCPIGVACGAGKTTYNGRTLIASTERLLGSVSISTHPDSAELNVEGRRIIVRDDEAVIDNESSIAIPASCQEVEFSVSGAILMVSFDRKPASRIARR